jgi:hypothetical protein
MLEGRTFINQEVSSSWFDKLNMKGGGKCALILFSFRERVRQKLNFTNELTIFCGINYTMRKKKVVMARLIRREKAGDDFDITFWQRVGAPGIFEAMWLMLVEQYKRGKRHGRVPRLRRSVAVLKRRYSQPGFIIDNT